MTAKKRRFSKKQEDFLDKVANVYRNFLYRRQIELLIRNKLGGRITYALEHYSGEFVIEHHKLDEMQRRLAQLYKEVNTGYVLFWLYENAKKLKIPRSEIDKRIARVKDPAADWDTVRLLIEHPSKRTSLKQLVEQLPTANRRETEILWKYLQKLRGQPTPQYRPSQRTIDYAKLRRHWGRIYK